MPKNKTEKVISKNMSQSDFEMVWKKFTNQDNIINRLSKGELISANEVIKLQNRMNYLEKEHFQLKINVEKLVNTTRQVIEMTGKAIELMKEKEKEI